MTRTNSQILLTSLAALGVLAAGCDIYPSQAGGAPAVVRVLAVDNLNLTTPPEAATPDAGGTYILGQPPLTAGIDASNVNSPGPGNHASRFQVIDVQLNKVMDGGSIQTSVSDCAPVAGSLTVTVTPAQPTNCGDANQSQVACFTNNWQACYLPQTGDPSVGSQIFIFQLPKGQAYDASGGNGPAAQGGSLLPGFTYAVTGTAKDYAGTALTYKTTVTTQTAPMITGATTTQATVEWSATTDVTAVQLQRAPDDGTGAPGTFADVVGGTTTPFPDGGLTPGTIYWYQLVLNPGASQVISGLTNVTTLPDPVDLTGASLVPTAGQVVVNWTVPVPGAGGGFEVQRSGDVTPRTYKTLAAIKPTIATYTDKTTTAGTVYWYRVVSVAKDGVINEAGTEASVTAL